MSENLLIEFNDITPKLKFLDLSQNRIKELKLGVGRSLSVDDSDDDSNDDDYTEADVDLSRVDGDKTAANLWTTFRLEFLNVSQNRLSSFNILRSELAKWNNQRVE